MKNSKLIRLVCIPTILLVLAPLVQASDTADALGRHIQQLAKDEDFPAIEKLIQSEEGNWKAAPTVSYFENMKAISTNLGTRVSNNESYWLFRKLLWLILFKPFPPVQNAEDISRLERLKEDLLWTAVGTSRYDLAASPDMNAAARHDTAEMLMAYPKWVRTQIIPNYHRKPVASANDPVGRKITNQNYIDNTTQEELQNAVRYFGVRFVLILTEEYHYLPKNEEEAMQLIGALNVQGAQRESFLEGARHPKPAK